MWLDAKGDQFERLLLADGYARVRMYAESFEVLAGLLAEELRPRTRSAVHKHLGHYHYQVGALDEAQFHLLEEHARQPPCGMPHLWKTLAAVAFEMGHHAEAAQYAESWQTSNEAVWRDFKRFRPLSTADRLLVAKYLSHVDRERALAEVDAALGVEPSEDPKDVDAATEAWIAALRQGEAPAEIPPLKRPWLEAPQPSFSAEEAMRRAEVWQERRWRLTRPAEQPGGVPREEWVTDSWRMTPGAIPPPPPPEVPLAMHPPAVPALVVPVVAPIASMSDVGVAETSACAETADSRGMDAAADACPTPD